MNKNRLFTILGALLLLAACSSEKGFLSFKSKKNASAQTDNPQGMMEWQYNRVKNPKTGEFSSQALVDAYNAQKKQNIRRGVIPDVNWSERGPNNVGGRTRAIIFDANDATHKTAFAASVSGGLFKCTDVYAGTPKWVKQNDFFANLAINCMVQNQDYPDTIYFGTGEGYGNKGAQRGAGVWRSINGGVSWTQLPSLMAGAVPFFVTRLALNSSGHIYAATNRGAYKSTNGGNTWTSELNTITSPSSGNNSGKDLKIAANGDVYYSNNGEVWRRNESNGNWTEVTPSGSYRRIEIAVAPSDANFVYLLCQEDGSNKVNGFFSTNDKGATWRSRTVPKIYDQNSTATTEISRNQAWYDLALTVDPNVATTVYAGAIDYVKSTDTGATYKQISAWSLFAVPSASELGSNQKIHADHHILVFKPGSSDTALFGHDGGLTRSYNMSNTFPTMPTYEDINSDYNVTQYYACAMANVAGSNNFLAGSQDNGTQKYANAGINSTTRVTGGDGGFCFIDQNNATNQISSYTNNNYYVSTNGINFNTVSGSDNTGDFINVADLDDVNDILYSKKSSSEIRRWADIFGSNTNTDITLTGVNSISAIKVSPHTATTLYIGADEHVYKVTNANTGSGPFAPTKLTTAGLGGRISCIQVRENSASSDDTLLVTISSYGVNESVWYTTNSSATTPTWTNIDDNATLPDMPINWALFAPTSKGNEVILATELGIYTCDDIFATSPTWGQSNNGFANVPVFMLQIRKSDSLIIAATHGRGLYSSDKYSKPNVLFEVDKNVTYLNNTIQFTDKSLGATSWAWDFDNNGTTDATTKNPTHTYSSAGLKTVKLTINAGLASKTITNAVQVLPNKTVPYTLAAGGDFESNPLDFGSSTVNGVAWERGNSAIIGKNGVQSGSNAWVTGLTATTYDIDNETYLYTPNFDLSQAGTDTLRFHLKSDVDVSFDGMRVEYSLDKGTSWSPLGTSVQANWYDDANASAGTPYPLNEAFFSKNITSYTPMKFSITSLNTNADVAFRFVFKSDDIDNAAGFAVDNFEITRGPALVSIETAVSSKIENFGPNASVDFYSSAGKLMARLINNTAHDYGATTVSIDNAGSGAMNYSSNTDTDLRIAQKTFAVSPANNNTAGNYTAKFYYTQSELAGWRAATGNTTVDGQLFKCPVSIATGILENGLYATSPEFELINTDDSAIVGTFSTGFSGFGFGKDVLKNAIFAEIVDFELTEVNLDVRLDWKTNMEVNCQKFEIERSTDNINFVKVGEVAANGNSTATQSYNFTDINAFGSNNKLCYRLKVVNTLGASFYTAIEKIEKSVSVNKLSVNASINYSNQMLSVSLNKSSSYNYTVVSTSGAVVLKGSMETSNTKIDVSSIPEGIYILYIKSSANEEVTHKFHKAQ